MSSDSGSGASHPEAIAAIRPKVRTALDIVRDFIHTVLVVDDRAEISSLARPSRDTSAAPRPSDNEPASGPRSRMPIGELVAPDQLSIDDYDSGKQLDALALTAAFAKEGLVCGILRPTGATDLHQETVRTACRSDVVVLDWSFDTDNGQTALSLIKDIIADDEPDRLRFVAIYTGEIALPPIAERIVEELSKLESVRELRRIDDHVIERGPLRIAVFGKPSTRNIPGTGQEQRRFTVQELPGALIAEYGRLHAGLLATAALAGVSAIRRKTDLLLARFRPELDPGFLWHRAVLPDPEDAEQHFIDMLVAEIGAVIEDAGVGALVNAAHCVELIRLKGVDEFKSAFGTKDEVAPLEAYESLFTKGVEKTPQSGVRFKSLVDKHRAKEDHPSFAASAGEMTRANDRFTELMTLRTRYSRERVLSIGTILRLKDSERYFLCVLPACDSVRINEARYFVFVPLSRVTDATKKFSLIAPGEGGEFVRLAASFKVYDLKMISFHPDTSGRVRAKRAIDGQLVFASVSEENYIWVADLKPFKAQSEAQNVSGQLARPGIDEPEWLRADRR